MKKSKISPLLVGGALLFGALLVQAQAAQSDDVAALIKRGEYLSRVGDCMACHSAPGKPAWSGGLAIQSAFGPIYSTNISPDPEHGIGRYSEQQFAAAVRRGVRADGAFLYPAMPYPDYAKVSDADIHALYVYFTQGVKPSASAPPQTALPFPFNQRWGIRFWNWLFTDHSAFHPPAGASAQVQRGAYLVEGLGHCGSCHTARGFAMNEKTLDSDDAAFLAGGDLNGWPVPSLRGVARWSQQEIVDYLKRGRNDKAAVAGEMTSVVANSTSWMSDEDLQAIAAYLKFLSDTKPTTTAQPAAAASTTAQKLTAARDLSEGERLYLDNCNACHFVNGQGAPPAFPPLDGASVVNARSPGGLIQLILRGAQLPSTASSPSALAMPGFARRLNDAEVAALATFVRQGWHNHAPAVTADQVKSVRQQLNGG